MSRSKQRVAFVGCGGITDDYLSVYRDLDWVEVVTCVDTDLARAQNAATVLAAGGCTVARTTSDFTDALRADVDTVVINTPNHVHREQAIAALEAGKHLLLQKPVAANLADAEAIAVAAERALRKGIKSGLYMSYFDQPLMHDLRAMKRTGWFGDVTHTYARLMHRGGLMWSQQTLSGNKSWRGSLEQTGGGCFIQLAVHYIHLFEWMLDSRVVKASAVMKNLHCPGLEGEDIAAAILEFESGALATLDMAWNAYGEQLSVHGTRGSLEYLNNRLLVLTSDAGAYKGFVVNYSAPLTRRFDGATGAEQTADVIAASLGDHTNPFNQHRLFLEAVRDDHAPFVTIASGVEDMRVVSAVYEAARSGRSVTIERQTAREKTDPANVLMNGSACANGRT